MPVVSVIDRIRNGPAPSLRIRTELEVAETSMLPGNSAAVVVGVLVDAGAALEPGARVVPGALVVADVAGVAAMVSGTESSPTVVSGEVDVVDSAVVVIDDEFGSVVDGLSPGASPPHAAAMIREATRTLRTTRRIMRDKLPTRCWSVVVELVA